MKRIYVICEGQTEEMFVNEFLSGAFVHKEIYLTPILIGKPGHKGGNFKFERLLTDVKGYLLGDADSFCTTFFDFYGLPEDFPGKREALSHQTARGKANVVMQTMRIKLEEEIGGGPLRRFIPYIQMYEFEGLLFSATNALASAINRPDLEHSLRKIKEAFSTPEEINNSPTSAPSKRIVALHTEYDKPIHGSLAAIEMGLSVIRQECQLFNQWLERIENL